MLRGTRAWHAGMVLIAMAGLGPFVAAIAGADPQPPAPPVIRGISSTAVAIKLEFAPNVDQGSAVTEYGAHCTSRDGGRAARASGPGATRRTLVVSGVTVGHTYTCTLDATSADGTGDESAPSPKVVVGRPNAPELRTSQP